MNRIYSVLVLLSLIFSINGNSQDIMSGEITYTTKINMHRGIPDDDNGEMIKSMIPEFQSVENTLLFSESESLYKVKKNEEVDDEPIVEDDGGMHIEIEMGENNDIIYTNLETNEVVEQRDLMGKQFLIKDSIDQTMWKITGEQKVVSGLNCMRAEYFNEEDSTAYIAWFTSQIPISTGPAGFSGLPGLIVYVDINDGEMTISVNNIMMRKLEKKEIQAPKKGKVVSNDEFRKIEEEKMEQMRKQYGGEGGGNVMIITQ